MYSFSGNAILLDIEGTTSSISFVYDVMFPFARRELASYLEHKWESPEAGAARDQIARDAGHDSFAAWTSDTSTSEEQRQLLIDEVLGRMDRDEKSTGLKQIQGLIWRAGFESGEMRAHVYDDVPPALAAWREAGLELRIYSSGSIAAQKLFFGHTERGDLLSFFSGHYDTTTGGKRELDSYRAIAADFECPAEMLLFISDVVAELDAAAAAGLQTALCVRPGNPPASESNHSVIHSFDEIDVRLPQQHS